MNADNCYAALLARDRRFDGVFFVGVRSTGVFCRPVCPARTPLRKNCDFYESATAAMAAGFRPCLKCRPESAPGSPPWRGTAPVVDRALRMLEDGAGAGGLGARVGMTDRHLRRLFLEHVGAPPVAVAQTRRVLFAKRLITETALPFTDIAFAAGYSTVRRFHQAIQVAYRRPPNEIRRQAAAVARSAVELRLAYRPPYRWDALIAFLSRRAIASLESVDAGHYARDGVVTVRHDPDRHCVVARLDATGLGHMRQATARIGRLFDLDADGDAIARHLEQSPVLAPIVRRFRGVRLPGCWDPFELCIRAILGQQVTVKGAATLLARLVERFGPPRAEALADAPVECIGLPGKRAETIRRLAKAVSDGKLRFDGAAADLREAMLELPGIGPWTADYVLMRALGEPDCLPAGDLGLLKAAGNVTAKELDRMAEAWRPWRSYATFYLWQSLEVPA